MVLREVEQARAEAAGLEARLEAGLKALAASEAGRKGRGEADGLEIARRLGGAWKVFYGLKVLPRPLRDGIYDWIARNRYRWFGRTDTCPAPDRDFRDRFLP